jgi:hypothetical protein
MFVATFASLVFLYQARQQLSRGVFATLTGVALAVWGFQDGIFRRDDEWLVFHFYYDLTVALLMVFFLQLRRKFIRSDRTAGEKFPLF